MMMCRFTHQLAAIGTMSWPILAPSEVQRRCGRTIVVHFGTIRWPRLRNWKHLLAVAADGRDSPP